MTHLLTSDLSFGYRTNLGVNGLSPELLGLQNALNQGNTRFVNLLSILTVTIVKLGR